MTRAVEWDAHKVVVRGHCMGGAWGIRKVLTTELFNMEREMGGLESVTGCRPSEDECLRTILKKNRESETQLWKHDYRRRLAALHAEGDSSGWLLAWLVKEDSQDPPIGAI
ncbi:hypothetical protein NDU88_003429 [Pleurodeles waltl]|uniref:Uncharacterized protein n=1 Tax=Pleurodeles waltl TaxID=8319 RepID=A0AAV7MQI8_PLEWA|nr:hypothetical protein NDU88_003429 [Pleurodeles waltl]